MKKLKGGISSIIAVIVMAGIVVALIIGVVLPITNQGKDLGETGKERMSDLKGTLQSEENY